MRLSVSPAAVRRGLRLTAGLPARTHMPIGMERRWFRIVGSIWQAPKGMTLSEDSLGGVPASRAACDGIGPGQTIMYFHGGGYVTYAAATYGAFVRSICLETKTVVYAPDYPLAPERPFPAALDAGLASYRALAERVSGPIVLGGDSAGGGLAVATALALRDAGDALPAGMFLFSPWLDLSHSGDSFKQNGPREPILTHRRSVENAKAYAAGQDLTDPRISPLFADSIAGLPPTYMLGAADDLLVSDADRFAERVREAGGEIEYRRYEGLWHDFQLFGEVMAEAREATSDACAAIGGFFETSVAAGGAVEAAAQG